MTTTKKEALFFLLPFSLIILSFLFPKACTEGAKNGLEIGLFSALPSLFPAMVLSKMMVSSLREVQGKKVLFLPFILGLLCGFPVGAYATAELCKKNVISKKDGETMLFFANNPGPAFLIGYCGEVIFHRKEIGWFFFLAQSALSLFFFLFFFGKKSLACERKSVSPSASFSQRLTESFKESAFSFLYMLSCIVFFSFLTSLAKALFPLSKVQESALGLMLEMTGGIRSLAYLPRRVALLFCGAGIGWGGMSVHLQTMGVIREAGLSSKKYFLGKGVFSFLLTLGVQIFGKYL